MLGAAHLQPRCLPGSHAVPRLLVTGAVPPRPRPTLQEAHLAPQQILDLIDSGNSPGGGSGRHWVLDPIDGTRGFVGMRQYAVCLGMLQDGEVGGPGHRHRPRAGAQGGSVAWIHGRDGMGRTAWLCSPRQSLPYPTPPSLPVPAPLSPLPRLPQVVLGVLGCPNLPQYAITEEDCDEGQAGRSFSDDAVGSMFAAAKGQVGGPCAPAQRLPPPGCADVVGHPTDVPALACQPGRKAAQAGKPSTRQRNRRARLHRKHSWTKPSCHSVVVSRRPQAWLDVKFSFLSQLAAGRIHGARVWRGTFRAHPLQR